MSRRAELLLVAVLCGCGGGSKPGPTVPPNDAADVSVEPDAQPKREDVARPADSGTIDVPSDLRSPDAAAPNVSFCDPYAAKICERLAACLPRYVDIVYGDLAACQDRFRLGCRIEGVLPGTGRSKVNTDACTTALGVASCDDVVAENVPACQLTGILALGAACGSSIQCGSGFCRLPETGFCGKCAGRAAEGGECDSDEACSSSLLCSDVGRCARPGAVGAFCNETRPCPLGVAFCSLADNTCQRYAAEGKSCNRAGPSPFLPCNWGLACRPSGGGTCQPIRYVAAGASCGIPMSANAIPVLCLASGSCVSGTCKPAGADDAPCTASPLGDSGGCLPPALCLGGICKLPDPAACK